MCGGIYAEELRNYLNKYGISTKNFFISAPIAADH